MPQLTQEDETPAPLNKEMHTNKFEQCSTYANKPNLKDLGLMAKDIAFDWIKNSENYPSIDEINDFLKNCKNDTSKKKSHTTANIKLTQEQQNIIETVDQQIQYIKKVGIKKALKDVKSNIIRRIVLQGKAGSGKSTIIHEIEKKIIQELGEKSVIVVAPTGAAAVNIGGITMHSAFKLGSFSKLYLLMTFHNSSIQFL